MEFSTMPSLNRDLLKQLVAAIASLIREYGGAPTKTKLLKLLYLADVENWRDHGQRLTDLNWIFYLYGPWTNEYDDLLSEMKSEGLIDIRPGQEDGEATFINALRPAKLENVALSTPTYFALKELIERWGPQRTADLLDYVYFETEPMLNAERGQVLDFGSVKPRSAVPLYRPVKSQATSGEIARMRRAFQSALSENAPIASDFTPARYDESFIQATSSANLEDD
jgi:hypothetical protein